MKKKIIFLFIIFSLTFVLFLLFKNTKYLSFKEIEKKVEKPENIKDKNENENENENESIYSSNIIKDVSYSSKDSRGNEYIIFASQGEIDYKNTNVVYLTEVQGLIKLEDSNKIIINSDYGKYNINNFDTIFSKNVIVKYLDNTIKGEYLDFSIKRNSMIISKNVIYTNFKNVLEADLIEINIKTKDTKISRYNNKEKVNVKSKN
tara:strand:+ start:163 stop:777 length:615 start_codon:yes stop_codon:yes gene_type:complete